MRDLLAYVLYRAVAALVPLLPRRVMVWVGRRLGGLYCTFSRRCRAVGLENLRRVFPERTDHATLLRRAMRQAGVSLLDALWSAQLTPEQARRHVDADPADIDWFRRHTEAGRGIILATAHFGSWEMFNLAAPTLGFPNATFLARPVRNARIDRHLRRQRERTGNRLAYREEALAACVGALRRGEVVCSVIDMAIIPPEGGLFADFFGIPATTSGALPLLALRRGAPLMFAVCRPLDGGMRYRIEGKEIEVRRDAEDRDAEVRRIVGELNRALEAKVRAHPEAWIWDYKRWHWRPGEWPGAYPSYSLWVTKHL